MNKNVLGRGLASLLKEEVIPVSVDLENNIPLEYIIANKDQPRKYFDPNKIRELADSINSNGLIQPIIVKRIKDDEYRIIAGERRFRACTLLNLEKVPVIIKDLDSRSELECALIENIQREELSVIEESEGYLALSELYNYSHAEIASSLGKSRSHVSNMLRLNSLPDKVKNMLNQSQLSMGHARCLVGVEDAVELAEKIVSNGLNVRQTEELIRNRTNVAEKKDRKEVNNTYDTKDDDYVILGQSLSERFGVKVIVENSWNGGRVIFNYSNLEELDKILNKFN
jgi:ParB family chromosome partitioning protein